MAGEERYRPTTAILITVEKEMDILIQKPGEFDQPWVRMNKNGNRRSLDMLE